MTDPKHSDPKPAVTRREFLETAAGVTVAGSLLPRVWAAEIKNGIPYRTLGNTGENVSCIGLGGYHLGSQSDEQESIRIIRTALDEGINFLDNCWDYNGGASEVRMGKALRDGYRKKAFLMTKMTPAPVRAPPARLTNRCADCKPTPSISCNFTR